MIANVFILHFWLQSWEDGNLIDPQAKSSLFGPTMVFLFLLLIRPIFSQWASQTQGAKLDTSVGLILGILLLIILAVVPCPVNIVAIYTTLGGTSFIAYYVLRMYSSFASVRLTLLGVWWTAYYAIWMIGANSPIHLPMYLIIWTAIGFGGGLLVHSLAKSRTQSETNSAYDYQRSAASAQSYTQGVPQTRRRAARTSGTVSRYGRIPQDTVDLLTNHIRRITGPIVAALPIGASVSRRNQTVYILLDTVVSDWRENDNFDLMTPEDIDDFQSFIEAASFLAGSDETPLNNAVYEASLAAFARDWLANWNETDNSGPPDRIY